MVHAPVAVAIAADPLAHAQEAGHRLTVECCFKFGIQLGNLAQEGRFVVRQGVFDLVSHRQLGKTQQSGLPQLHHAGTYLQFIGRQFARTQGVLVGIDRGRTGFDGIAIGQQMRNVAFGVQNAFALYFGRVGGEHG